MKAAEARRVSSSAIPPLPSTSTYDHRLAESLPNTRRSSQEDLAFLPTTFPGQQNYQPTLPPIDTRGTSSYLVESPSAGTGISPVLVGVASSLNWRTALATTPEIRRPISPLYQIGSAASRPLRERSLSLSAMGLVGADDSGGGRKRMRIDESFERGSPIAGALEEMV